MRCADDAVLWAWAGEELSADARAELETHLAGCEGCRQALVGIGTTRTTLRGAARAQPTIKWRQVDDAVMGAATERFARAHRPSPLWALAGAAAIAALAFILWTPGLRSQEDSSTAVASTASVPDVHVESARGARVIEIASAGRALEGGAAIHEGARIQTEEDGSAFVRLPEESRARLGPRTDAVLKRARADAVDIQLHRGAVVVEASHAARERFVIDALEAQVRVIGTVFRVSRHEGQVVVAVSEGRVLVEPRGGGQSRFVDAGQRVVLGPGGAVLEQRALAAEDHAAFAQLSPELEPGPVPGTELEAAPAPEPQRRQEVAARPSQAQPKHPSQPVPQHPLQPQPEQLAPVPAAPPQVAVQGIPMSELETPDFGATPAEETAQGAQSPEQAHRGGLPTTAEALFLRRAEEALRFGRCGSFLLGLADITETSEDGGSREIARILRARCFDDRLEPVKAQREYRKYLNRHPAGRFAGEARRALAE